MQIEGIVCSEMKANSSPEMCGAFYVFGDSNMLLFQGQWQIRVSTVKKNLLEI